MKFWLPTFFRLTNALPKFEQNRWPTVHLSEKVTWNRPYICWKSQKSIIMNFFRFLLLDLQFLKIKCKSAKFRKIPHLKYMGKWVLPIELLILEAASQWKFVAHACERDGYRLVTCYLSRSLRWLAEILRAQKKEPISAKSKKDSM